ICVDRDPAAEERFESFAREVECETRFLRMDYGEALELLIEEGIAGDMAYLDLGVSSMQIDTWERGFSYSYDAPLDMRMDPGQERLPGAPQRRERRARLARARASVRLDAPAPRRAAGRHLVPLARGPAREALPGGTRARVHLPSGSSGLRVRPHARGRAHDAARDRADRRRGGAQPARRGRPPSRGAQA